MENAYKEFDALIDLVPEVIDWVDGYAVKYIKDGDVLSELRICVEEIFVNICSYAYPKGPGKAELFLDVDNNSISLLFADYGIPYNPLAKADPNLEEALMDRAIGGLGIFMVKNMMDRTEYEYKDGKNCFRITKMV